MMVRNRNEKDQDCISCRVKETIEHFLVECTHYEEERDRLIGSITAVISSDECHRRLKLERRKCCAGQKDSLTVKCCTYSLCCTVFLLADSRRNTSRGKQKGRRTYKR